MTETDVTRQDICNYAWQAAESKCSGGCSECALAMIDGVERCPYFLLRRCVHIIKQDQVTITALLHHGLFQI